MWVLTFIVGSFIYIKYRTYIRIPIEQAGYWKTQGFFDFKEHVASIGLVLLPAYWFFWKNAQNPEYDTARKVVTVYLAIACWFLFIVGHVLNNTRGFAHEHADSKHQSNVGAVIMGVIDEVQDLRGYIRGGRAPHLHGLPLNELAGIYLSPCSGPLRLGVGGGKKRRGAGHELVRLDRNDPHRLEQ